LSLEDNGVILNKIKRYFDTFVDDAVHIEIKIIDLREGVLSYHVLDKWISFDQPDISQKLTMNKIQEHPF
jgi:hypothetical protein